MVTLQAEATQCPKKPATVVQLNSAHGPFLKKTVTSGQQHTLYSLIFQSNFSGMKGFTDLGKQITGSVHTIPSDESTGFLGRLFQPSFHIVIL